jgi:hypothetical protein
LNEEEPTQASGLRLRKLIGLDDRGSPVRGNPTQVPESLELLVTADAVTDSLIIFTLMMETIHYSETSVVNAM